MKLLDPTTSKGARDFAYKRNRCKGSLVRTKVTLEQMLSSPYISKEDTKTLTPVLARVVKVLNRWDKHYTKKYFHKNLAFPTKRK